MEDVAGPGGLMSPVGGSPLSLVPHLRGTLWGAPWGSLGPGWVRGGDRGDPTSELGALGGGGSWARLGWGRAPTARVIPGIPQVEVEVESMDKAGNFIGWLHIEGVNLSVALVEQALSRVHFTAERSPYCKALLAAQDAAKQRKEKVRGTGDLLQGRHHPTDTAPSQRMAPPHWISPPREMFPLWGVVPMLRDVPIPRGAPVPGDVLTPGNVTTPMNVPTQCMSTHREVAPPQGMSPSQEMFHPKERPHS